MPVKVSVENFKDTFRGIANRRESKFYWNLCETISDFEITAKEILDTKSLRPENDVIVAKIILSIISRDLADVDKKFTQKSK